MLDIPMECKNFGEGGQMQKFGAGNGMFHTLRILLNVEVALVYRCHFASQPTAKLGPVQYSVSFLSFFSGKDDKSWKML